jgi:hypothetical protein
MCQEQETTQVHNYRHRTLVSSPVNCIYNVGLVWYWHTAVVVTVTSRHSLLKRDCLQHDYIRLDHMTTQKYHSATAPPPHSSQWPRRLPPNTRSSPYYRSTCTSPHHAPLAWLLTRSMLACCCRHTHSTQASHWSAHTLVHYNVASHASHCSISNMHGAASNVQVLVQAQVPTMW